MPKPCAVLDCESPAQKRGWCNKHYLRWRTWGDRLVTKRGQSSWNAGMPWSEEIKAKQRGKVVSAATREKIRAARQRQVLTPSRNLKISVAHLGRAKSAESVAKRSGAAHYRWKGGQPRRMNSAAWRRVREEVLERDGYACVACGKDNRRALIVHHRIEYDRGGPDEPWNLVTACRACHNRHHALMRTFGVGLSRLNPPPRSMTQ